MYLSKFFRSSAPALFFLGLFLSLSLSAERSSAEIEADKAHLNYYLSGNLELKGSMMRTAENGNPQHDTLRIFIRNGSLNSWARWLGSRKSSYYSVTRRTYGKNGVGYEYTDESFQGPINVKATLKGLVIEFFEPSPEGTTDFTDAKLRRVVGSFIRIPFHKLYNKKGYIDFNAAESKESFEIGRTFEDRGLFWTRQGTVFANAGSIAVSDQKIAYSSEVLSYYLIPGLRAVASSLSYWSGLAWSSASSMAHSAYHNESAYDLAMMSAHVILGTAELYAAMVEASMLNPLAFSHARMAWGSSKNAIHYYQKFMGSSEDVVKANISYLESIEKISGNSYNAIRETINAGEKAMSFDPSLIIDIAKAARNARQAWQEYYGISACTVAPAA